MSSFTIGGPPWSYIRPLKPKITFRTMDGKHDLLIYNSFDLDNADMHVAYVDCDDGIGSAGNFNIVIEDSNNELDRDLILNKKVYIELGKTEDTLQTFIIGQSYISRISRPRTNYMEYQVSGYGSQYKAKHLFLNRRQASKVLNIDSPVSAVDHDYDINIVATNALTKRTWRPLKEKSIKSITGWREDLISPNVNINFPVVNWNYMYFGDAMDQLSNVSGAVWGIEYRDKSEYLLFDYITNLHTGVVIKTGDLRTELDDLSKTSYVKESFNIEDNSTDESGYASRLYTTTIIERQSVTSQFSNKGGATINGRAIAQQAKMSNDGRRITDLAFILTKIGEPQNKNNVIEGDITLDDGNNGPNGTVLNTFQIDLGSIEPTPRTIFVNDIDFRSTRFLTGDTYIWIRLFPCSGIDGKLQYDPLNTIRWHHNGIFNTLQPTYSAYAPNADRGDKPSIKWFTRNTGPTYDFAVFANIRRMQSRSNDSAIENIGLSEHMMDSSFLSDPAQVNTLLSFGLKNTAKIRRTVPDFQVTNPDGVIFKPYQLITFADGQSGTAQDLIINSVRYTLSALPGGAQLGTYGAELSVSGLTSSLLSNCRCA